MPVQYFVKSNDLIRYIARKYGDKAMGIGLIKESLTHVITLTHTRDLRKAVQLPDNYFQSLIEAELEKRLAKAKLLRAHGRLIRREGQACLI